MTSVVEPALTDWPTERPTSATVPLIGLVSCASARFCWAVIKEAVAESIDAWSLASCCALFDAVSVPTDPPEPPVVDVVPPVFGVVVDFVADPVVVDVEAVPALFAADPPLEAGLPVAPEDVPVPEDGEPDVPVVDPGDPEVDEDDELSCLASAVSALETASRSLWYCCCADSAWARALRHAVDVELPDVLEAVFVVDALAVASVDAVAPTGGVPGAVPVDEPPHAVCAAFTAACAAA
jgi:hypothetical protein